MDPKLKKKLLLERNKRLQIINQHALLHQEERDRAAEEDEKSRAAALGQASDEPASEEAVWSARTQEIRNRLTGKKRAARDRWNRFSGTSSGGGMGR